MHALFAGHEYYPAGGWDDLRAAGECYDDVVRTWNENQSLNESWDRWSWGHIVNLETRERIDL